MKQETVHIADNFYELATKTIDGRERIALGKYLSGHYKRVRIYQNKSGELLLQPIVEIPASEMRLYQNKKALSSVKKGLKEAKEKKISKLDLNKIAS